MDRVTPIEPFITTRDTLVINFNSLNGFYDNVTIICHPESYNSKPVSGFAEKGINVVTCSPLAPGSNITFEFFTYKMLETTKSERYFAKTSFYLKLFYFNKIIGFKNI